MSRKHDAGGRVSFPVPMDWKARAEFSGDNEEYRQVLSFEWGDGPLLLGLLKNPSIATPKVLDPTLLRFADFAKRWDYAGFTIVNVFDYRLTDSRLLPTIKNPVSDRNLAAIEREAAKAAMVLAGFGEIHKAMIHHAKNAVGVIRKAGCGIFALAVNKDGMPKHPLYIKADTKPEPWEVWG